MGFSGKIKPFVPVPKASDGFVLYAANVKTGKSEVVPGANAYYLETLLFDSSHSKVFSLGLALPSQNRTLVSLDVPTNTFKLVGTLSKYSMLLNDLSAIDADAGVLYTYLQDTDDGAFYLIGISVSTGRVVHVGSDGLSPTECPLTMQFASSSTVVV